MPPDLDVSHLLLSDNKYIFCTQTNDFGSFYPFQTTAIFVVFIELASIVITAQSGDQDDLRLKRGKEERKNAENRIPIYILCPPVKDNICVERKAGTDFMTGRKAPYCFQGQTA